MSIRITWENPNTIFEEIRLYRTDAPIDINSIPVTPLTTMATGTTYLDTTAKQDTYYYYTTVIIANGEPVVTPSQLAYQLVNSGPGPTELLCGNMKRGFFGICTATELFTQQELADIIGIGGVGGGVTGTNTWLKFIYEGKILFFPTRPCRASISWNTCYYSGLIYGTDDTGPSVGQTPLTNQLKIVSKGNNDFIVRAPRVNKYGSDFTVPSGWTAVNGEYSLIPATIGVSIKSGWDNAILANVPNYFTSITEPWCQETTIAATVATPRNGSIWSSNARAAVAANNVYMPVLELVR